MNPDVMTIVQYLSRYLRNHPEASDTSEGIAQWWVAGHQRPAPIGVVETALDWMASCGVVEVLHALDGRVRYRRLSDADDLEGRLDALSEDPQAVMPLVNPKSPPRSIH